MPELVKVDGKTGIAVTQSWEVGSQDAQQASETLTRVQPSRVHSEPITQDVYLTPAESVKVGYTAT